MKLFVREAVTRLICKYTFRSSPAYVLSMMRDKLTTVKKFILLADEPDSGVFNIPYAGEVAY